MGTEPKLRPIRKAKYRYKLAEQIVDYIVEIEDWDFSYWLVLNTQRKALDPYHEHRHLQFKGRILRPTGLKTDRVEVSLLPSIGLEEERRKDFKPIAVGSLELYPERIDRARRDAFRRAGPDPADAGRRTPEVYRHAGHQIPPPKRPPAELQFGHEARPGRSGVIGIMT